MENFSHTKRSIKITMWQYNGVDKFSNILAWCYRYLDVKDWDTNCNETIWFKTEQAYTLFLLKWG